MRALTADLRRKKRKEFYKLEGITTKDEWQTFLQETIFDSVSLGICTNEDCSYTTEVEPDCDSGYCEECDTCTVASILILEGII